MPDAVKQVLQSVTSFAAFYQDPSARHHVRPPDQPPHLNRQVGLLEQLLHEEKLHTVMEDDPGTHGVEGWVCHRTVPPEAGPGALKEITQNNVFFICGTSPVVEGKPDTVVEYHHHQVGLTVEAVQLLAGGLRGNTSAGNEIIQVQAVRKLRQLLGEELDPPWTVMDMSSSMLLLLDYSHTVTFKYVARFSAAIDIGLTLDNFDIVFSGEFMSFFADNGTDSSFLRLLKLMRIENVFTMSRRAREVIRSVHMVLAVQGNTGMKLCLDAYCFEIDPG